MAAVRSILICDDESELAAELAEFFASFGWRAHVGSSGHDAEALLRSGLAPTCILTDLRMADGGGEALVATIRSLPKALQPAVVAIMTGHIVDQVKAADLGADLLYVKPIDPDQVVGDLDRLTSDGASRRTNQQGAASS